MFFGKFVNIAPAPHPISAMVLGWRWLLQMISMHLIGFPERILGMPGLGSLQGLSTRVNRLHTFCVNETKLSRGYRERG